MKQNLDSQMLVWAKRTIKELKLDLMQANKLGSTIETEIHSLPLENKRALMRRIEGTLLIS